MVTFNRSTSRNGKKQLEHGGLRLVLELREVTLVDVDFLQFLGICEFGGIEVTNCPPIFDSG